MNLGELLSAVNKSYREGRKEEFRKYLFAHEELRFNGKTWYIRNEDIKKVMERLNAN